MPRKRKPARQFQRSAAPSDDERQVLELGAVILNHHDPPDVRPEPQLERVWRANRDGFLAVANPGRRPWAWWRFDAREPQPTTSWGEYERLEALGQITADERLRFTNVHFSAAPEIRDPAAAAAIVIANWRREGYSEYMTRNQAEEREFRAAWHARTGNESTAQFYRLTAAGLREIQATES